MRFKGCRLVEFKTAKVKCKNLLRRVSWIGKAKVWYMPIDKYRGISLTKELVGVIENYVKTHPEMGYKSLADFVTVAIREKCEKLGIFTPEMMGPSLEHFNLDEQGVRILDRTLGDTASRGSIIDVYFKPENAWCEYCESTDCRHVKFALSLPEVQKILREKGWELHKKIKET